jgi:NhaA family Na+:H+ antiporter
MSLFITDLAFDDPTYIIQSKIGIFIASILGGLGGFLILRKA